MSADDNSEAGKDEAASADGPVAGERLAVARRDLELTVEEVAKELHLDDFKVRALERNEFEAIGAPVFAKGHLRKYAQIVGINPDDVLADYYTLNRTTGMPPVVGNVRKPEREIRIGRLLLLLLALLAAGAAYWWIFERQPSLPPRDRPAAMPSDTPGEGRVTEVVRDESRPDAAPSVPETRPAVTAEPAADVTQPMIADTPLADDEVRVVMRFSGDCWTEITDANGDRLFFQLGRAGRTATVTGEAPLSVLFGNADNVSLEVNGEPYRIAAAARRNQTARFTIGAR